MLIKMDVFPKSKVYNRANQNQSWQTLDLFWANINYVLLSYLLMYETLGLFGLYLDFQSLSSVLTLVQTILNFDSEEIGFFFFDEFFLVLAG